MRILHLNEHLEWKGGVEVYLLSSIPELERRGHHVLVAYAQGRRALASHVELLPELGQADRAARAAGSVAAKALIDRYRPDIVHVHQTHNQGVIRACLDAVPTIVHGHDYRYLCPASTFFYRRSQTICNLAAGPRCFAVTVARHCLTPRPQYAFPYYQRVRWAQRQRDRFSHVIAPSESCRERFLQARFDPARVTTLPYFCPIPTRPSPRALPPRPTILFIGRVRPNKGYQVYVRALGRLPAEVRGVMVGDFNEETHRSVMALARSVGCDDRIELRPWAGRESISAAFEQATVFVFPSIWPETLGIVGLEALATGVPVVASDVGGVREWLLDGQTGYLVPPGDAGALAERVGELMASPDRNLAFGRNGIALIEKKFAMSVHTDRLEAIYRQAAGL